MGQYHDVSGDHPQLELYAKGEWVSYAQQLLTSAGFPPMDHQADGFFGPLTDEVVRDFQGSRHLHVDGIIGPKTWAALEGRGGGGGGGGSTQLEFATRPMITSPSWLQWSVLNSGSGVVPAHESGGTYEVYEGDTTLHSGPVKLTRELQPYEESAYLSANLLSYTPNDGTYMASVQVGSEIEYVNYVVRDGKVEAE